MLLLDIDLLPFETLMGSIYNWATPQSRTAAAGIP